MKRQAHEGNAIGTTEETGKPVPAIDDIVKAPAKPPKKAPEDVPTTKESIRAQLEKLQAEELNEVVQHVNAYLAEKGCELVPIVSIVGTSIQAQVQIRRKVR